jgi:hypothetical protein
MIRSHSRPAAMAAAGAAGGPDDDDRFDDVARGPADA